MGYKSPARVFDSHVAPSNLARVYMDHVIDGVSRGRDGMPASALERELEDTCRFLSRRLKNGSHSFIQYKELVYLKGAHKLPRVVSIPSVRDRVALRALADFLAEVFPEAVGELPQVTIREVAGALSAGTYNSFVRLDLRDFYPSISHYWVERALRRRIRRQEIIDVVLESIRTPTVPMGHSKAIATSVGVPQGLALSNIVAEMVMGPIDHELSLLPESKYFRFVDDILILCNRERVDALDEAARAAIEMNDLKVHPREQWGNKSCVGETAAGLSYLGYKFTPGSISVRASSVHKLEARIAGEFTKYRHSSNKREALRTCKWRINLAVTGCIYQGRASGWLPYYRQMNDLTLLKELDSTVQKKMARRFRMPPSFEVKSFMRAYWSIAHPNGVDAGYLPRFDGLSVRQMRLELEKALGRERIEAVSDERVPSLFRRTMRRITSELEQDIGDVS